MNSIITRTALLASLAASLLAGCASTTSAGTSRTAYEKACRSPMMKGAAAREAYWCWQRVGAASYDEWMAYEQAARVEEAELVAARGQDAAR